MRAVICAAVAISVAAGSAHARDAEVYTVEGAVLCVTPFQLREARTAAARGDANWLKSLGCASVRDGVKAILIRPNAPLADPWQARLNPDSPNAATVWGGAEAFRTKAGKKFWPPDWNKVFSGKPK